MWRSLLLAVTLLLTGAGVAVAQEEPYRIEDCGYTFPVESYAANVSGLDIALPANDRLVVNGRVLAEHNPLRDRPPQGWRDSSNTAEIAIGRHEVVVRTSRTDCIDYQWTRIYVISELGDLRAAFAYPQSWERAVLSYRAENIVYVSNFDCEFTQGAPQGQVWTHVLSAGASEFVRESRPRAEVCDGNDAKASGLLLFFMPMQALAPDSARQRH
jgi:hypothetical protein